MSNLYSLSILHLYNDEPTRLLRALTENITSSYDYSSLMAVGCDECNLGGGISFNIVVMTTDPNDSAYGQFIVNFNGINKTALDRVIYAYKAMVRIPNKDFSTPKNCIIMTIQ